MKYCLIIKELIPSRIRYKRVHGKLIRNQNSRTLPNFTRTLADFVLYPFAKLIQFSFFSPFTSYSARKISQTNHPRKLRNTYTHPAPLKFSRTHEPPKFLFLSPSHHRPSNQAKPEIRKAPPSPWIPKNLSIYLSLPSKNSQKARKRRSERERREESLRVAAAPFRARGRHEK